MDDFSGYLDVQEYGDLTSAAMESVRFWDSDAQTEAEKRSWLLLLAFDRKAGAPCLSYLVEKLELSGVPTCFVG